LSTLGLDPNRGLAMIHLPVVNDAVSWDEAFADRYDEWSAPMTADVPFYVELAREADGPLVELAVGSGRVAVPVAQATGRPVIGIDFSPAMLAQARVRAAEAGVELDLREGDMRDLALQEPAALIYCPFRALLHLPTWSDRRRTFERVAASLRPGGRFAWNAFAFDHRIAARLDGQHEDEPVPHTVRYAVGDNRIDISLDDGGTSSLWWATRNEWLGLVDVAGLEVEALYGGFEREPFTDESREYVFVATRRS
jgi:ubiquinone/menaquinone biosynthesis C-methylase UbiE